jgi:hypothetical protein
VTLAGDESAGWNDPTWAAVYFASLGVHDNYTGGNVPILQLNTSPFDRSEQLSRELLAVRKIF